MSKLTFFLLLALAPATAVAQTSTAADIDDVRKDARLHVGPFYMTPLFQVKELGVDSNVFNAAGEPVSDFTTTVAPKLNLWVPVARRALLKTTAAADLVWYAQYETERSVDPEGEARAEIYLRRITLFGEGHAVNTRQRMNYEIDARARQMRIDVAAGVELRLASKFSLEAAANGGKTKFDADEVYNGTSLQRTLNQRTRGGRAVARHRVTSLTTIAVKYEQQKDEFEFSPLRNSRSFRVMPGVELKPRALVKGTAYIGYRKFTPSSAGVLPDFSGLVADLGLSYTMLGATTFGVSYRRDLTYSYEETQPFFVSNSVGASVRRALGRRFDVLGSVDRHVYDYVDLIHAQPTLDLPPGDRVDTTWNYAASLGYRVGDGRIGFGASYWTRDSTTRPLRGYDNLRIGTTATYGF
jgi:hypothetical protein